MQLKRVVRGFTLLEVLIAAVLLVVGLVGSIALTVGLLRGSQTTRARDTATFIAQQILDQLSAIPIAQVPALVALTGPNVPTCYAMGEDAFIDHPISCALIAQPPAFFVRTQACCQGPGLGAGAPCAGGPLPALVNGVGIGGACSIQVEVTWPREPAIPVPALFVESNPTTLNFQNHILTTIERQQ